MNPESDDASAHPRRGGAAVSCAAGTAVSRGLCILRVQRFSGRLSRAPLEGRELGGGFSGQRRGLSVDHRFTVHFHPLLFLAGMDFDLDCVHRADSVHCTFRMLGTVSIL